MVKNLKNKGKTSDFFQIIHFKTMPVTNSIELFPKLEWKILSMSSVPFSKPKMAKTKKETKRKKRKGKKKNPEGPTPLRL